MQKALDHPGDPLPLNVRARLAPVMGRELGAVRLLRTAEAAAATTAAAADALAYGDKVLLSPGQDLASPRGLGLLAHELTHVLRGRDPGYLPPVALHPAPVSPFAPFRPAPARPGALRPVQAERLDEEGLAEHVEAQVRQRAHLIPTPLADTPRPSPSRSMTRPAVSSKSPWGDLPAPWEPMPFWDAPVGGGPESGSALAAPHIPGSGHAASSSTQASAPGRNPTQTAAAQTASSRPPGGAPAPVARAASSTRSVDSSPPPAPAPSPLGAATGSDRHKSGRATPDLDRLAQQVYGLIKRRLATETRRDR